MVQRPINSLSITLQFFALPPTYLPISFLLQSNHPPSPSFNPCRTTPIILPHIPRPRLPSPLCIPSIKERQVNILRPQSTKDILSREFTCTTATQSTRVTRSGIWRAIAGSLERVDSTIRPLRVVDVCSWKGVFIEVS